MAAFIFFLSIACNTKTEKQEEMKAAQEDTTTAMMSSHEGGEETALYECPMKCEGGTSHQEGKCPKCGMDLEKKANEHEGHSH